MWTKLRIGIFGLITILCSCINVDKNIEEAPNKFSEYIGRYQLNTNLVIEVLEEKGQLQIRPSFWRIARRIDSLGIDSFSFRNTTTIQFQRDSMGQITSLVSSGHRELEGTSLKLAKNDYQPVELLISGKTEEAIKKLKENSGKNPEATITSMAFSFIRNYPSRSDECNKFISSFETLLPNSVDLYQIKGLSSLLSNDRITALHAFERAFEIDSSDNLTKSSLRLLGSKYSTPPPSNSWKLPFSIDQLFSAPTKDEIERVKKDWNNRNLKIDEPEIVVEDTIMLWDLNYQVKIIRHKIYDKIHYGAVLIPEGVPKKKSPLIIEARGVDPEYSPKDIT